MASLGTWMAGGALVFATLTVYTHFTRRSRDRARRERLRRSWGQAMERGGVEPDRPRRESIDAGEAAGRLDDQTWGDLLLGPIVAKLDRTITAVGSQTLYRWIRRPELSAETLQERDAMIEALRTDPPRREQLQDVLLDFGVLDHLARRHLVLAATHDLELGDRVGQAFTEAHFCEVANDEGELDFDYRLRPGRIERPNAIALLARVGYPPALVQRAIELVEGRSEGVNAPA